MMQKNSIDFDSITSKAYETLIIQEKLFFPLDVFSIKLNKEVIIVSFDEMANRSNTNYETIKELADGELHPLE